MQTDPALGNKHPYLRPSSVALYQEGAQAGAFVVVIDPVRTRTAELADQHIALLPGTDSALAMGILNVIVSLGAENAAYIEKHTLGWDALRDRVLDYTPEYVAELTGIDVETIIDLGTRVARTRPTAIRAAQGVQRHAGGGMTLRALASIPGVTGDWALPGGGLVYSTDGYFGANLEGLWRDDLSKQPVRTLSMTRLGEGLLDTVDPPVMALIIYAANPLVSSPQQDKIRRGLARTDLFTVVMEHFMTDTADYADIVLPATMQTEHADLHDGYGHLYIAWNEPAVEAPGECLSTTETFRQLARYMGLSEPHLFDSDETLARQLLTSDHPSLDGIDLETLKKNGWMRLNYPQPFVPYRGSFSDAFRQTGVSVRACRSRRTSCAGWIWTRKGTGRPKAYERLSIHACNRGLALPGEQHICQPSGSESAGRASKGFWSMIRTPLPVVLKMASSCVCTMPAAALPPLQRSPTRSTKAFCFAARGFG